MGLRCYMAVAKIPTNSQVRELQPLYLFLPLQFSSSQYSNNGLTPDTEHHPKFSCGLLKQRPREPCETLAGLTYGKALTVLDRYPC